MDKPSIRQHMRRLRKALAPEVRRAASESICRRLISRLEGFPTVAVYLATADEIDLSPLISVLLERGATPVAPRWNGATYDLARLEGLSPEFLRRGPMEVKEPAAADLVEPREVSAWIVPGLAFTRDGRRLGYGGGWYDRLLSRASEAAPRIGVAYSFQVVDSLPSEAHDIMLTEIVYEA